MSNHNITDAYEFKHFTFDFNVSLVPQDNDDLEDISLKYPDYSEQDIVCQWYNNLDEVVGGNFEEKNTVVKYDKNRKIYTISFDAMEGDDYEEPEIIFKMLIDPDDDGNHPIKINGSVYLIMGEAS